MNIYNYNHLYYFYITAKLNGVTVAAKHLNTSQSSLSTQIKTLESTLKKSLFKKSGRKIVLTDSGREVYNYCRRAFEAFDEMFDQLDKKSHRMGTRLSVGVSAEIDRPFISDALSAISRLYPKGQRPLLNLISLPSNQLLQLLKIGELDILLSTAPSPDSEIQVIYHLELPVGLFAHGSLQNNFKNRTIEKTLSTGDTPVVLPAMGTQIRSEIDNYLIRKKINPICLFESNILGAVSRAATDGLGVTILPEAYVNRELKANRLARMNNKPLWNHRLSAITTRDGFDNGRKVLLSKLADYFQSHLKIEMRNLTKYPP